MLSTTSWSNASHAEWHLQLLIWLCLPIVFVVVTVVVAVACGGVAVATVGVICVFLVVRCL